MTIPNGQAAEDTNKWAFAPVPPGRNPQEYLEELARSRGVSPNELTQQLAAVWSNAFSQHLNGPIQFYGQTVDENGVPLKNATAAVICLTFPEKQFTTNIPTDSGGLFALHGLTGQGLNIRVSKEGYQEIPGTNQNTFFYHGIAGSFQPDPADPVVFHLRKKNITP